MLPEEPTISPSVQSILPRKSYKMIPETLLIKMHKTVENTIQIR